jgi:hypothetical protein
MSKVKHPYTGLDEPSKDQRRATPLEASKMKQIRYYGTHEVSSDIANEYKGISSVSKDKEKRLIKLMGGLRGKIDKLRSEIEELQRYDDDLKNKKYTKEIKEMTEEKKLLTLELEKVLKKLKEFRVDQAEKKKNKNIVKKTK